MKGRLIGPLDPRAYPYVMVSSLGAVPKKHCLDKWRLILDLSHPKGASVNDGIDRTLCSLTYMKVDDVVQQVLSLGKGTLLAKVDIESAFRNIPVHPDDRHLLGILWDTKLYIDTVLPFGLRSAPKIFNSVADALQWIAKQRGITYLEHFLDDFITVGAPHCNDCGHNLSLLENTCAFLGLPLKVEKCEGPSTCLIFLGIELDTVKFELRLPAQKLKRLQSTLQRWCHLKCCTKRDLESLVGQLHDASIVVRPGRTFIRRLIDLLKSAHHRPARGFIRLNIEARSDILWWAQFITHWNGLSMMQKARRSNPDVILTSDASGSWGCGAFYADSWFQLQWPAALLDSHITVKELLPIVIAAGIWGAQWANKFVLCRCDNEAVVHIINTGTSKDPTVMCLMRCLYFITAKFDMTLSAVHLAGSANGLADALSRNQLKNFFANYPQASPRASHIPAPLLNLLIYSQPDWVSPSWSKMFSSIFAQPSQTTRRAPIPAAIDDISTFAHSLESANHTQHPSPSSASSLGTLDDSALNIRPSNATYPVSDTSRSCSHIRIPSYTISHGFTMSSEESNQSKRRKIANLANGSQ